MKTQARLALAWCIAPLTAVLFVVVVLAVLSRLSFDAPPPEGWLAGSGEVLVVLLLYGAPVAYGMELLVGVPAYRWLHRRHWLRPAPVILIGSLAGFAAFPLVTALTFSDWSWALAALGAAAGATAGSFFWAIGLRPSKATSAPARAAG